MQGFIIIHPKLPNHPVLDGLCILVYVKLCLHQEPTFGSCVDRSESLLDPIFHKFMSSLAEFKHLFLF